MNYTITSGLTAEAAQQLILGHGIAPGNDKVGGQESDLTRNAIESRESNRKQTASEPTRRERQGEHSTRITSPQVVAPKNNFSSFSSRGQLVGGGSVTQETVSGGSQGYRQVVRQSVMPCAEQNVEKTVSLEGRKKLCSFKRNTKKNEK